jgi:hypothetical protein
MIARAQLFSFRVLLHLYPAYRAFPARNPLFSTIRNSYVACRAAHALVLAALTADVVEIHRELRARWTAEAREALTTTKAEVDPNGSAETRRSLSRGSAHYAVVPSLQIHEFPDGGWCQPGTETQLLAKDRASGNVVWQGSSDGATDLSLVSVSDFTASPWTTSTVQTMAAPLQVVHSSRARCPVQRSADAASRAQHSRLRYSVHWHGQCRHDANSDTDLSVHNCAWTTLPLASTYQAGKAEYHTPSYSVHNGIVHLRGRVAAITASLAHSPLARAATGKTLRRCQTASVLLRVGCSLFPPHPIHTCASRS